MNSMRGAVPFEAEGGELTFRITMNAMVRYEDAAKESFPLGLARLEKSPDSMVRLRRLFWAGLSHIPGMTEDRAGDIVDEIGFDATGDILRRGAEAAFPAPKADEGNAAGAATRKKTATR